MGIINTLSAITVIIEETRLVIALLIARSFRYAIDSCLINVRIGEDADAALCRISERILVPFTFSSLTTDLESEAQGFVISRARNVINLSDYRLRMDSDSSRVEMDSRDLAKGIVIISATLYLCAMGYFYEGFRFAWGI